MAMKRKLTFLIPVLAAGFLSQSPLMAADAAEYEAAMAKAREAVADAEKKTQLWTTIDTLLERSAEAAGQGDFELAVTLANEAGLHAQLAVATAEREKQNWQLNVPK
jgi:hypothetical protein